MDKIAEIAFLLDIYGSILTEKERDMLDLHYNHDLSLAEIAEQMGITRQAVHDGIKRGQAQLYEYENKLGLLKRYIKYSDNFQKMQDALDNIQKQLDNIREILKSFD